MSPTAGVPVHERVSVQGLVCHELRLPDGDRVRVAEHGGHVLSWVSGGHERLYLSACATFDGHAAIRGGVPVCWPQFSDRGELTRHGWVRQSAWQLLRADLSESGPSLTLGIRPQESFRAPKAGWPHTCRLELRAALAPGALDLALTVFNEGHSPLPFTGALHTYIALENAEQAVVSGWQADEDRMGWDSEYNRPCEVLPQLGLCGEIDRVLPRDAGALRVEDGTLRLQVEQFGWTDTVVWNPGQEKCTAMADMCPGDERRMACVEAAQVFEPVVVAPGSTWSGSQRLRVLEST